MNIYKIYCMAFLLSGSLTAMAQEETGMADEPAAKKEAPAKVGKPVATRTIKGRVIDGATHAPKAGVMVRVTGHSAYSSITEDDGVFEIKVPVYATSLNISVPDYNPVKKGIGDVSTINDIYIYPTTFSADYTAEDNISGVRTASGFQYSSAVSIEEEIQKKLGGTVHTTSRNGTPGVGAVMFMNGITSLNVNAQPLIVVDGVIFDQQYGREMVHSGFYNDVLSNINPADIQKVTVLKNGTALYGAKGSNGVILIETRRSQSMATRISASISAGFAVEPKHYDMMNGSQYRNYASELIGTTNTTLTDFVFLDDSPSNFYYDKYHNNTNWNDYIYQTAMLQNYGINVEGGDAVAKYNLSLGYTINESTLKNNSMNRLNIRFNTDIQIIKPLSVKFDVSFVNQTRDILDDGAPSGYTEGTPTSTSFLGYVKSPMLSPYAFSNGVLSDSYIDITDENYLDEALANYGSYNYKLANPLAINEYAVEKNKNRFETSMINIAVTPKFQINDHLSVSEHFSYNLVNTSEKYYIPLNGVPAYYVSSVGDSRENEIRSLVSRQNSVMSDTRVEWDNQYGAHTVGVFVGARINWETYTLNTQLGYNTGNDKTPFMSSNLKNAQTSGISESWNSLAWYAQADYNYKQRYYLRLNLTAESSSRFGTNGDSGLKLFDAVWGIFPGVQASWVVTNEKWFSNIKGVDFLKIYAGYDITGNDDIDNYAARSYFSAKTFLTTISGLTLANIGNDKIQWETTKKFNVGIEGNFLNNRLNAQFNFFTSKTDNLLTYQTVGFLSGTDRNWGNGGKMKNTGFDASLMGKVISTKNWQWELGASVGHYKNEITALPDGQTYFDTEVYGATVRAMIGESANVFYGYKTNGVFATSEAAEEAGLYMLAENGVTRNYFGAGDMMFVDQDGNKEINESDMVVIGDPNPDVYGNIFTSLSYKRFKLDLNFNYSVGNDIYNYMRSQLEGGSRFLNQTTAMNNRWKVEGQVTDVPRATFQDPMGNSRFSDRWIEDGSYLKLKTVTLSYKLPLNSTFLQGLEFWIQANNVFTITDYLGIDPESAMTSSVIGQGIDTGCLPLCRSFLAGVKINL